MAGTGAWTSLFTLPLLEISSVYLAAELSRKWRCSFKSCQISILRKETLNSSSVYQPEVMDSGILIMWLVNGDLGWMWMCSGLLSAARSMYYYQRTTRLGEGSPWSEPCRECWGNSCSMYKKLASILQWLWESDPELEVVVLRFLLCEHSHGNCSLSEDNREPRCLKISANRNV